MRQIILDTETTGLSPEEGHRVIEIGCVEMINRRVTGQHQHYYLNPERAIDEEAVKVHGITNAFLHDKPVFAQIVDDFLAYVAGAELIIHNAPFDVGFLNAELRRVGRFILLEQHCTILDTLTLARQKHPGQPNNLDALCRRYGVNLSQRTFHGALLDANLLANVYLMMTSGQVPLFSINENQSKYEKQEIQFQERKHYRLKILKPTTQEKECHEQYMAKILK